MQEKIKKLPEEYECKRDLIFVCNQIYVKFLEMWKISWTTNKMHKIYFMNIFTQ